MCWFYPSEASMAKLRPQRDNQRELAAELSALR
jgi:hypothetical protein